MKTIVLVMAALVVGIVFAPKFTSKLNEAKA